MPPSGHPDAGPVPIADAAVRLSTSPEAIRKRLARGSLRGEKHGGRWVVWLPQDAPDRPASGHQDAEPDANPDATIAALQAHIDSLERQLASRAEEVRGLIHLLRQEQERNVALPATIDVVNVPQERDPGSLRGAVATEAEPYRPGSDSLALVWRRWWRRIRGGE